jgi:hypothetical protein
MRNKLIWHEFFVEWMLHYFPVILRKRIAAALMAERKLFPVMPAKFPSTENLWFHAGIDRHIWQWDL